MLSEPQCKYIERSTKEFLDTLTPDQVQAYYFRLDDFLQYAHDSLSIAYRAVREYKDNM